MTRRIFWIGLCCLLFACASTSIFIAYPNQAAQYRNAIAAQQFDASLANIDSKKNSLNALLYLQESGRLNQLAGNFEQSLQDFAKAIAIYQGIDDRAKISASKTASQAGALVTNDNAIAYEGAAYERVMVLLFQALNYLNLGKPESAAVEIRRAAQIQRRLELQNQKALQKDTQQAQAQGINDSWQNSPELQAMKTYGNSVRSSILNAYCYYLSAVFWEAQNNINDALVDYKKALQIQPNNMQIKAAIAALSKGKSSIKKDQGLLVVIFEQGLVPSKQSFSLSLPNFSLNTYMNIAVPFYEKSSFSIATPLKVYENQKPIGQTQLLTDVSALAAKALYEKMSGIVVRQALRMRSKMEVQRKAQDENAALGLVASLFNIVSEQADRRSWLTLPSNVQATRINMNEGTHTISIASNGYQQNIDLKIHKQRITLLRVIQSTNTFILQPFML